MLLIVAEKILQKDTSETHHLSHSIILHYKFTLSMSDCKHVSITEANTDRLVTQCYILHDSDRRSIE